MAHKKLLHKTSHAHLPCTGGPIRVVDIGPHWVAVLTQHCTSYFGFHRTQTGVLRMQQNIHRNSDTFLCFSPNSNYVPFHPAIKCSMLNCVPFHWTVYHSTEPCTIPLNRVPFHWSRYHSTELRTIPLCHPAHRAELLFGNSCAHDSIIKSKLK